MNCEKALELISAELDGELTQQERAELQAHLDACPDCRETYAQLHELDAALQESELEPPAALHDGVMQTIRREKKRRRPAWLPAAAIAVAAALALLAGRAGIIALPGFGGDGALANDASHAAQSVLKGQTQDDAARVQALADEYGAAVMILRNAGTPEALAGMEYQTLADGGRLYAVTQTVYQQLQGRYADAEMTAPQTETHNDTAYVLLIP